MTLATVLKIENVVSISTPFNNQVTEIDHREEISYIVSEEFSEQFTALAFIDFKEDSSKKTAPLVESVPKKPTFYEIKASFGRRRSTAKTRLASQVLKIKLALHDFRTGKV